MENISYKGQFYVFKHDTLGNTYDEKFEQIIKPCLLETEKLLNQYFSPCVDHLTVTSLELFEVINRMSKNFTGKKRGINIIKPNETIKR